VVKPKSADMYVGRPKYRQTNVYNNNNINNNNIDMSTSQTPRSNVLAYYT